MTAIDFYNNDCFFVENDDGTTVKCDILISVDNEENGKLIVFTDGSKNENGAVRAFASRYNPAVCGNMLLPIEDESDRDFVGSVLRYILRREKIRARLRDVQGSREKSFLQKLKPF